MKQKILQSIQREWLTTNGFSLVEIILAISIFALIVTAMVGALIFGQQSTALGGARAQAVSLAEECQEAVRNIRDENFANLTVGNHGLTISGNQWTFSGTSDVTGIFTRQAIVSDIDTNTKSIICNVNWQQNQQRPGTVSLVSNFTNWRTAIAPLTRGGILVYGDGGTTSDTIKYKILDKNTGTWSAVAQSTADIDTGSTNRALRSVQAYSSSTRNEKIMISRHYNGSTQYIYAQVFNGTNWDNVTLLSTYNAITFLDVQNFSGTYLANGDFMAVYSDNTTTPKYKIWNGSSWSVQYNLVNLASNGSSIPLYIIAKARPGTNEVMVAIFGQGRDTNTQYYNGAGYIVSNWVLHPRHAFNAPSNNRRTIDFDWSQFDSSTGMIIYSTSRNDRTITGKVWTANGSGGGSWSSARSTSNMASNMGTLDVISTAGKQEFIACNKDLNSSPRIQCFTSDFTPSWTTPANNLIVTGTDTGIQRSYHMGAPKTADKNQIIVYSDTTNIPKLKKYDSNGTSWDAAATNMTSITSSLETVRIIPSPVNDDLMILLGNTNQDVYSIVWDASNNNFYTTPTGKAFSSHGLTGSTDEDYWFDFAWDKF